MQRLRPDVDIVLDILKAVLEAEPNGTFVQSIHNQYLERGGLSKKQLQGLYGKASRISTIPPGKLATLEAIIKRKALKDKSPATNIAEPVFQKNEQTGKLITKILEKYPAHKRVLFLQTKFENDEILSAAELAELKKFEKLLLL